MGKRQRRPATEQEKQHHQQRALLLAQINTAFDGVPMPDHKHRTLRQAEAWDNYATADQRNDFRGRWQDLPISELLACPYALPHLDAQGIHYYLPAILCAYLQATPAQRSSWLFESMRYTLQPEAGPLKAYQRSRFHRLTAPQRAAICAFVEHIDAEAPTQQAWQRVVSAGDDPDWFRRFY